MSSLVSWPWLTSLKAVVLRCSKICSLKLVKPSKSAWPENNDTLPWFGLYREAIYSSSKLVNLNHQSGLCFAMDFHAQTLRTIWILQVWLQEFAWSEKEKPSKLAIRNGSMAIEDRAVIDKEPMFCMETMMTCFFWSYLVYDYEEVFSQFLFSGKKFLWCCMLWVVFMNSSKLWNPVLECAIAQLDQASSFDTWKTLWKVARLHCWTSFGWVLCFLCGCYHKVMPWVLLSRLEEFRQTVV